MASGWDARPPWRPGRLPLLLCLLLLLRSPARAAHIKKAEATTTTTTSAGAEEDEGQFDRYYHEEELGSALREAAHILMEIGRHATNCSSCVFFVSSWYLLSKETFSKGKLMASTSHSPSFTPISYLPILPLSHLLCGAYRESASSLAT